MKRTITTSILTALLASLAAFSADAPTIAKVYESQLSIGEHDVVPLAEAMPADKYSFAPTNGTFKGVRTFAQQVKHIAAVNYLVAAASLSEQPPIDIGKGEDGPESMQSKADIVEFLKGSYRYAHKAMQALNAQNQLQMVKSPFGSGEMARSAVATFAIWHPFDHYGQMVVYARMNGVVPPASR